MSDLTSCYFCGTALDAPVERYPLTPPSIDATTGRSVALCPTCRRKLVKVLEIVGEEFDAVVAEDDADDDTAAAAEDTATDESPEATDEVATEEDATDETGEQEDATDETGEQQDSTGETDDPFEPTDETEDPFEPATEVAEDDSGTTDDEHGDDTPAGDSTDADSPADSAKSTDVDPVAATDPTAGDGGANPGAEATDESESPADAGGGGKPDLLSTPAAQKVIKLLQNREFPLEREEFEIVASNAYDIPMGDCEEVIDTLVAEGYVAEDGSMLTRPE